MKIVIDTNIVISGLLWSGGPNQILKLAEQNKITLIATQETLIEFERVLNYPKFDKRIQQLGLSRAKLLEFYKKLVIVVPKISLDNMIVVIDPTDDEFLSAAKSGNAELIVSGDPHLLNLGKFENIGIITASEFLTLLEQKNKKSEDIE
jgi:hypothetical protein